MITKKINMKNTIKLTIGIALLLTAGLFPCYGQQKLNDETKEEQFDFNQAYNFVFRGNISRALELLDTTPDSKLTIDQKKLREQYKVNVVNALSQLAESNARLTDSIARIVAGGTY